MFYEKKSFLIYGILIVVVLIPLIFYSWFTLGMISTNSPKPIKLAWVFQYKSLIKKDFININDVNIYYKQGSLYFDFITNKELSLEECKHITRIAKEFIEKETSSKPLSEDGFKQLNIKLNFDVNNSDYVFECPYFTMSEEPNIKNNYKTWYFRINDEIQEKIEF